MPHSVRDARNTVATADSLWQNGQGAIDSSQLAQAYNTLHTWRSVYPDEYAHACYHYGRLLRAQDNPVAAMECFINATHSRTDDNHILGRVYSNMGSICHLASEFPLAYDMYERSADMFLRNGDTIAYYYALNDMAFEAAEMADTCACLPILNQITHDSIVSNIQTFIAITRAKWSLKCKQYDSAIYYAKQTKVSPSIPLVSLILAQSYSYMGVKDSAIYYAEHVLIDSKSLYDINNALYILTNDDDMRDKASIRRMAAERADIQKQLKINQGHLSQSVQLLEQDLNRKPDFRWLYAIIATVTFIGIAIAIYTYRKRRQHQLLSQKVNDLTQLNASVQQLHEQIVHEHADYKNKLLAQLEENISIFTQSDNFPNNINWKDFGAMCMVIDNNFNMLASKLRHKQILSEKEIRLCILVLMNISRPKIAELLRYSASGIGKFKDQTAKKIGTSGKKMHTYLLEMAVGD